MFLTKQYWIKKFEFFLVWVITYGYVNKLVIKFHITGVKFPNLRYSSRSVRLHSCELKLVNI
ncbi:hypothetical protein CLV60_11129 [Dyadobacter jiangsuensis]|uniref:Uncharacterized protein n=1 Tax=Dyadobacter jiangsuensis TaxID=1591085 RepID=A0A2P8FV42_9BACT|nr:hypothetical protein CLV60_11129 [Dyadobacter jiangsuensis]